MGLIQQRLIVDQNAAALCLKANGLECGTIGKCLAVNGRDISLHGQANKLFTATEGVLTDGDDLLVTYYTL